MTRRKPLTGAAQIDAGEVELVAAEESGSEEEGAAPVISRRWARFQGVSG
ncbi:MAG: hypothetical protein ACREQ5_14410 [Candidatus Dormibacteria bacterium]